MSTSSWRSSLTMSNRTKLRSSLKSSPKLWVFEFHFYFFLYLYLSVKTSLTELNHSKVVLTLTFIQPDKYSLASLRYKDEQRKLKLRSKGPNQPTGWLCTEEVVCCINHTLSVNFVKTYALKAEEIVFPNKRESPADRTRQQRMTFSPLLLERCAGSGLKFKVWKNNELTCTLVDWKWKIWNWIFNRGCSSVL